MSLFVIKELIHIMYIFSDLSTNWYPGWSKLKKSQFFDVKPKDIKLIEVLSTKFVFYCYTVIKDYRFVLNQKFHET